MGKPPRAQYEYKSRNIMNVDVDTPHDSATINKALIEEAAQGWEFHQMYIVVEPKRAIGGQVMTSAIAVILRREK